MKKVLMLSLAIMMVAGSAMADHIGIYADQQGVNCVGSITPGVITSIYVLHVLDGTASASQFKVQDNSGLLNTGAATNPAFLAIGTWNNGISLAYTNCLGGPAITLITLSYLALSAPAPCLGLSIVPDPTEANGIVKIADCNYVELQATSGRFFFNGDETCPCVEPTATEQSTWGKVKSLYR